jgi:hypothetical protein
VMHDRGACMRLANVGSCRPSSLRHARGDLVRSVSTPQPPSFSGSRHRGNRDVCELVSVRAVCVRRSIGRVVHA